MTKLIKKITIGLDILVLLLISNYTAIYILKYEIIFFQKVIIFSAIIVLIVCAKIFADLTLTPSNLFSLKLS